jgi:hypothetical protein
MADIKGVELKAAILFLQKRFGEAAVNTAIESLSVEDQALLPPVLLDSSWYPHTVWRVVRRISRTLVGNTESGDDFPFEMGKFMAHYAFTGVYRSLLEKTPLKQVENFAWIKDFLSRNARQVETKVLSDTSCLVRYRYEEGAVPTRSTCASSMGFWTETLELSGALKVKGKHLGCVLHGMSCCEYIFEWQ